MRRPDIQPMVCVSNKNGNDSSDGDRNTHLFVPCNYSVGVPPTGGLTAGPFEWMDACPFVRVSVGRGSASVAFRRSSRFCLADATNRMTVETTIRAQPTMDQRSGL